MLMISIKVDRPNHNFCLIKTKFKKQDKHFVSSLFFVGSSFFLEFKAPLVLLIYTLFSSKLQKSPKHFRNRLALAYSLTYSAKS